MSSSIVAFALYRTISSMIKPRYFTSLASSLTAPCVLAPKILTPSRILSPISVSFSSTMAVNAEDKIRRTDGDEDLLRILEHKIECAQEADKQAPLESELLKDSPFEIIDTPVHQSIILKREFQGEKIEVYVYMYFDWDADEEESEQDTAEGQNTDDDEEESEQDTAEGQNTDDDRQPHIFLIATVDKSGPALRFWCNLYAEDFEIKEMMMKRPVNSDAEKANELPEIFGYVNLNEGLQRAFIEYLGARGIKVSLYKFLREYSKTMDGRDIVWLKNLKKFAVK